MEITQAMEFIAGTLFFVLGLSYLFNARDWADWLDHLRKQDRRASLDLGLINILAGSFIIGFHWVWEGISLILTLLGVLFLIRGLVCLLFPAIIPAKLSLLSRSFKPIVRFAGILLVVVGGALLYNWYMQFVCQNNALVEELYYRLNSDVCFMG